MFANILVHYARICCALCPAAPDRYCLEVAPRVGSIRTAVQRHTPYNSPAPPPTTTLMLPYSTVRHQPYLQGLAQQDAEAVHLQRNPHVLDQFSGAPAGRNHRQGTQGTDTAISSPRLPAHDQLHSI